jgi:hypothetical protein
MVQAFPFGGVLNTDDPDEVIPTIHHRNASNIIFKGSQPHLRIENVPGTREKTNPFLINDGNNLTIGRFYDSVKKRIFFFNYRGDYNKAIYMYDTVALLFYRLVEGTVNADINALAFTQNVISNINIIYGDSAQGDILYWIDGDGTPKKINIDRAISGGYGTIKKSYLEVAKEPAYIPPYVVYEDDPSNTVNNCRKKLFRFKIRWVFDDHDKSVTSSQSEMPLPINAFDQATDSDPTKNCRIAIVYQTGASNVKKIEILASNSLGTTMSDFYLVASLDKSVNNIADNDVNTFLFYNDQGYSNIDITESDQIFDYVPIQTTVQTVLNGNVLAYGNITEGYSNLTNFSDGSNTSNISSNQATYYTGIYFTKLIANQSGDSGFGSGSIHIVIRGTVLSLIGTLDTYSVYLTDGTSLDYTVNNGDGVADVINGLRNAAISAGFTILSTGSNDLYITRIATSLARAIITSPNYQYNSLFNTSLNAYDWSSKYGFGLVYYDQKGRTNGVVYTTGFSIQTIPYSESSNITQTPLLNATIYHQPPIWAYYYQWVRTKNLSKDLKLQWITDRTFKDTAAVSGVSQYAYMSIESVNVFVRNNPGSPLGYTFAAGDRVRFFKRYNDDTTTANLYGNSKDFEITGSVTDPTINGATQVGQFIKILLPPTDGSFDFGTGFNNYFIELYTPAQPVANNLNLYYEFGERYTIQNPGLLNRTHQGQTQNQIQSLQPALFSLIKGDFYVRLRSIQTGNIYTWNIPLSPATGFRFLVPLNFVGSSYNNSNVTAHSVPLVGIGNTFDASTDTRWLISVGGTATTFKVGGSISLNFPSSRTGDTWTIIAVNKYHDIYQLVAPFDCSAAGTYTFAITSVFHINTGEISDSITLQNDNLFLIAESVNNLSDRQVTFLSSTFTLTINHIIPQRIIDPNFSDFYISSVNSNGRAFPFDENANQVNYPTMYRWSLAYQTDTNINQTCRFYAQNFDTLLRDYGAIMRMMIWDKRLTIFQERKCGQVGVYMKFITTTTGSQQLITSSDIITTNNVQYYAGEYGVGNQGDSVVQSGFVYYFVDPVKGEQCRLSGDGIIPLSTLYKTKTWASSNISKYLNTYNYTYGGPARITGTFNIRKDNVGEYLCVLQAGVLGGNTLIGQTISFDETKNCFTSFYSFAPECIVCADTTLYSWVNGKMYIHDVITNGGMNDFYGIKYESNINRIFNEHLMQKKSWISVTQLGNVIWDCPEIYTNEMSYANTPQQSNLITQDFNNTEGQFNASFLSDINSQGGISDGDSLKGSLISITFRLRLDDAGNYSFLSGIYIKFIDSPLNAQ